MKTTESAGIKSAVIANRMGTFKIKSGYIFNDPELVFAVTTKTLIIKTEHDFVTDTITYWAYAPYFDIIKTGGVIPEYDVQISKTHFTFVKVD
jgi:hypothetical protein